METNNWRNDESRQKLVNRITDVLQRHMPQTGADGMNELKKIALRFEDKIYAVSLNQQDYLRRISLKMLSLESNANGPSNHFLGGSHGNNQRPLDPAIGGPRDEVYGEQSQSDIGMVVDGPPPQAKSVPVKSIQRALEIIFLSYLPRDAPDLPVVNDLAELGVPDAALAPALQVLETLKHQERRIGKLEEELRGLRALF